MSPTSSSAQTSANRVEVDEGRAGKARSRQPKTRSKRHLLHRRYTRVSTRGEDTTGDFITGQKRRVALEAPSGGSVLCCPKPSSVVNGKRKVLSTPLPRTPHSTAKSRPHWLLAMTDLCCRRSLIPCDNPRLQFLILLAACPCS